MYSYEWDKDTGGLLLNSTPNELSKEPRPVYYQELDILGFDKFWDYKKDDSFPYMWAESNNYYYRGRLVAKTKGGTCYAKPEIDIVENPEQEGTPLRFVDLDAMVEKNRDLLEKLTQETIKKVFNTYAKYKGKVDVFYVAFSGGKDSIATLDIVQRALPHNGFKVLFADTGMEFPDTYRTVSMVEEECNRNSIAFVRAKSHFSPARSWRLFGPPATVERWCCSVHKTAPQIIALREMTGKTDFTGMAFLGVRASESISRRVYDYLSLGKKHRGQYSCNPILEWNSAELFLYIYSRNLILNMAYKKGNRRAGCLVCPRAAERNDFMSRVCYKEEFDELIAIVKDLYRKSFPTEQKLDEFIAMGGWKARKNGRDIEIGLNYHEMARGDDNLILIQNPKTDWHEWIKTIGVLVNDKSPYHIDFQGSQYEFVVEETPGSITVSYDSSLAKGSPLFVKLLKNVFRKTACCVLCRECEVDCHNGCIEMSGGKIHISEKCAHCAQCHKVEKGCLAYKSLELPKGGLKVSDNKSLNCYSHHAPRIGWLEQFFNYKNEFDQMHSLGSQMFSFFKRFLRDAELIDRNGFSETAKIIDKLSLNDNRSWAIMLVNLAYTPQINWYIKRISMNEMLDRDYVLSLLVQDGAKESWAGDIWNSFSRFLELPFAEVGMGKAVKEKNRMVAIERTPWLNPDPRVILYSLYKFAEVCGEYYQFTLTRLLNYGIDSYGVSPTEIFGISRDDMEKILSGLSINYPDYINVSFTLDLDNINLHRDKTSAKILTLF